MSLVLNRCQAITWTNDDLEPIEPLGSNFNEISVKLEKFSWKKMHL